MLKSNILIIEDEKKLSSLLSRALTQEGYSIYIALDGLTGEKKVLSDNFQLIIIDVMLPHKDGLSVISSFRALHINTPVLIITAKGEIEDRIKGLDIGGDDYLVKPFAISELLARVRSLLRRSSSTVQKTIRVQDLTLDLVKRKVSRGKNFIDLSSREFALLEYFITNKDKIITRSTLCEHIWNYNFDTGTNLVDVYVNHLRNKIDIGYKNKFLKTIRGVGYQFVSKSN
ncbi:MAG: response regulator transcription factor [Ignavibacteria bacterium]|nr:response regulator transcription factor [Bacteroidota bacterium]MSQ45881.1 response regulator transcription factor [Ignavibacteria bacterium]